jgi:predicted CXXCH cytochrome family protein
MSRFPAQRVRDAVREGSGRRAIFALLGLGAMLAAPSGLAGQAPLTSDECVACHTMMGMPRITEPAELFVNDVHAKVGLGCKDCHAGPGTSADPHAGFRTAPDRGDIPEMCGSCHSDADYMREFDPSLRVDQLTEYWSSTHGRRLREDGDPNVATCVSCHPAHSIRAPEDLESSVNPRNVPATCGSCHADAELMDPYGLSTDQLAEYTASVHGQLLLVDGEVAAPACNDCHGNHGAQPPGVSSVRNVCGTCHALMADYFTQSGHKDNFDLVGFPGCSTCHDHHAVQPATFASLRMKSAAVCPQCHLPDDPRGNAFEEMAELIDSLHLSMARSRDVLLQAEDLGMEVEQAMFDLEGVNSVLHRALGNIHTFDTELVGEATAEGQELAFQTLEIGEEALEEHRFRTTGLALSSAIIVLLIGLLVMKIREMDARMETTAPSLHTRSEDR